MFWTLIEAIGTAVAIVVTAFAVTALVGAAISTGWGTLFRIGVVTRAPPRYRTTFVLALGIILCLSFGWLFGS